MSNWLKGYTQAEVDAAQDKYKLRFPPDLIALFLDRRPARGYDWRTDDHAIRKALAWPLEGMVFDIEHNAFWRPEWGMRAAHAEERAEIATAAIAAAPSLIPLVGHRFLPAEPNDAGNPVFSIYQTDIIYYGANLEHYFDNEFRGWTEKSEDAYRHIRFWSDLAG